MDKQKTASGISGGIFLIGLGVLIITGWWWPGIMLVIGLSAGGEQIFRGRIASGIGTIAFFTAVPLVITLVQNTNVSWWVVGGFFLIALGVITIVKAFFLDDGEAEMEMSEKEKEAYL